MASKILKLIHLASHLVSNKPKLVKRIKFKLKLKEYKRLVHLYPRVTNTVLFHITGRVVELHQQQCKSSVRTLPKQAAIVSTALNASRVK